MSHNNYTFLYQNISSQSTPVSSLLLTTAQEDSSGFVPDFANKDKVSKDFKLHAQSGSAVTETSCLGVFIHIQQTRSGFLSSARRLAGGREHKDNAQMNSKKDGERHPKTRLHVRLFLRLCTQEAQGI